MFRCPIFAGVVPAARVRSPSWLPAIGAWSYLSVSGVSIVRVIDPERRVKPPPCNAPAPCMRMISILGKLARRPLRIDLPDDLGGAVDHHLELADHRDELPAFLGSPDGVGRGEHVKSTW